MGRHRARHLTTGQGLVVACGVLVGLGLASGIQQAAGIDGQAADSPVIDVPEADEDATPDPMGGGVVAHPPKTDVEARIAADGGLLRLDVPDDAGGTLRTVPTNSAPGGEEPVPGSEESAPDSEGPTSGTDDTYTLRVRVEEGLGVHGGIFAEQVMTTLNDPQGWGHDSAIFFERIDDSDADFDLVLASPATTDELCAPLATNGEVSCGTDDGAVLNAARWAEASEAFREAGGKVAAYRHYLVNHEVGHVIGHDHENCPGNGELAPVMLQQTLTLDGCTPNGWPGAE